MIAEGIEETMEMTCARIDVPDISHPYMQFSTWIRLIESIPIPQSQELITINIRGWHY